MSTDEPGDVTRLRAAFAALAYDGHGDVDAERVFDARHGHSSPEERQVVVDELLRNPASAEVWRLASDLAPQSMVERSVPQVILRWLPMAAAVLLTAGLGWAAVANRQAAEPVYRDLDRIGVLSVLPHDAWLSRAQPVLRWSGVAGARYRVRMFTEDLTVIAESAESAASEFRVSPDSLRLIAPGARLLWQVEARVPGAAAIVSPTFSVRVP